MASSPERLGGRIAIITGAGTGIGRATAVRLAAEGATVIATSLKRAEVQETRAKADAARSASAGPVEAIALDVTESAGVSSVFDDVAARHGRVDILVASAGIELPHGPPVEQTTDDEWYGVFDVNVAGVFRSCRAALPAMGDGGSIVTVGSINSFVAWPNAAAYTATKGAVLQFTRALALETADRGIRVNCVCPGIIDTPLTGYFLADDVSGDLRREYESFAPLGRIGQPQEIASAIAFLASDDASFMTGSAVVVDGGATAR